MFDIGAIDVHSASLTVQVDSVGNFSHPPDILGLATITTVPEPTTAVFRCIVGLVAGGRLLFRTQSATVGDSVAKA
ncbi:MAG: hypothetical protein KDA96_05395 [Planctomycetaceae bacterium]|nr:hypothetical protein [Planctomycetaceae bacterium]